MPHFPTHNPLKKELNLENIYQKLPIGIELYDKEGNLIDTTNEINIREKLHAAEQEQRPALTADQRYSRFLKNRSQHIRHSPKKYRIMYASLSTGTYPPSNLTPIRNGSHR